MVCGKNMSVVGRHYHLSGFPGTDLFPSYDERDINNLIFLSFQLLFKIFAFNTSWFV